MNGKDDEIRFLRGRCRRIPLCRPKKGEMGVGVRSSHQQLSIRKCLVLSDMNAHHQTRFAKCKCNPYEQLCIRPCLPSIPCPVLAFPTMNE